MKGVHLACIVVAFLLTLTLPSSYGQQEEGDDIPWHRYQLEPAEYFPFVYGVASGDPTHDSILLWTYAQVADGTNVTWAIWLPGTGSFQDNVTAGEATISAEHGFTITVEAANLAPDTVYNYAFQYGSSYSRTGRTRTAPHPEDESFTEMKIAVMSCAKVWIGLYNGYREVAEMDDINLILHVGDWVYTDFDPPLCFRVPEGLCNTDCQGYEIEVPDIPAQGSCDDLNTFRHLHKIVNTDVDAREMRANHPMVIMPDNHDLDGSKSVNYSESDTFQAWKEWVPNRGSINQLNLNPVAFARHIRYGKLFDVIVLDTRNIGRREEPPSYLGTDQVQWLDEEILPNSTDASWRIIATSQVFLPWTLRNTNSILAAPFIAISLTCLMCFAACAVLKRRRGMKIFEKPSEPVDEEEEEVDGVDVHYFKGVRDSLEVMRERRGMPPVKVDVGHPGRQQRCELCCLSRGCMICALVSGVLFLIGLAITLVLINEEFAPDEITGVPRLSPVGKSKKWGGKAWDSDPASRFEFLQMLKSHGVSDNNVFVTGDLHMANAADVYDTIPGLGPKETVPSETTRYGVEFLPTGVTVSQLQHFLSFIFKSFLVT